MPQLLVPAAKYLRNVLPGGLVEVPDFLDDIWMEPPVVKTDPFLTMRAGFVLEQELVLAIPGLDAVSIVIGKSADVTKFLFGFDAQPTPVISLRDLPIAVRFRSDLLAPARRKPGGSGDGAPVWERDPTQDRLEITLASVTVSVDLDGNISVESDAAIDLPPCMIGDSGIVIEARDVAVTMDANNPPPGQPAGWRGLHIGHAALYLPGELSATVGTLELTDAYIGNGGFSGSISDTWSPALSAELFGLEFGLKTVEIEFVQNAPVSCELTGTVFLPFFDQPVGVDISVGLDGSFGIALSATQPGGVTSSGGLITFTKPGILTVRVNSLGFEVEDGLFTATISGWIRPEVAGIDWPEFEVRELSIDSNGNVRLEGGWLDLPQQYSLDFHGFQLDITRLGFGRTDDGGRWVGFSGGIRLVEGLTAGASVDGLRVTWYDDNSVRVSLDGVGVELEIPGTLRFVGKVAYRELPGPVHRFDGDIALDLLALDLQIDGKIVIGSASDEQGGTYTFFALYVGVELPAGIPLFSTGLGLYGIAGLIAIDMAPNKSRPPHEGEQWYENPDGSPGWYKRPQVGVTDLATKWDPEPGAFALGGGVTIGTLADNGFIFNGKVLLVISLPGPIILIEGKANLLKERASLDDNPLFRAIAVLDFREGTFLVGVDAAYKVGSGGELIEIGGSAEFFFSLADAMAWHFYLGIKDPRERRIRARALSLFEANSYFMVDATMLATGAWVGYDAHWKFGPLKVDIEAWIDGGVLLSVKPIYFHGELWLHGRVALSVFGIGFGLHVDARFEIDVFDPFHILAEFSVGIELPWPLPDFDVTITLEWGPSQDRPPLPVPLKEIAVEHFKASASWPLPRGSLLLPDRDDGNGFLALPPAASDDTAAAPSTAPVVPMDARPHLTFGRPVHDDGLVGVNPQPVLPGANPPGWDRVGDPGAGQGPMRIRHSLQEVSLWRRETGAWTQVARKGPGANPAGVETLYGSWAPIPALPSGQVAPGTDPPIDQVKLWLWSRTPFDFTSHGGKAWDEWFTDTYDNYPCIEPPQDRIVCCDVDRQELGMLALPAAPCPDDDTILIDGEGPVGVVVLAHPVEGHTRAVSWSAIEGQPLLVRLTGPAVDWVELLVRAESAEPDPAGGGQVWATGYGGGRTIGPIYPSNGLITLELADLREVELAGTGQAYLIRICVRVPADPALVKQYQEMAQHLVAATAHWADEGAVLQPDSTYRITVKTRVEAIGEGALSGINETHDLTEHAYLRTEGPPALAALATPVNHPPAEPFDSGLTDLVRYVDHPVPNSDPRALVPTRPVYRGYDVGAIFNEDYVDLMYRLARRDLTVQLYDANNQLVRRPDSGAIVLANRWGHVDDLILTESEQRYVSVIDGVECVTLDEQVVPKNGTLFAAHDGQVLRPDQVYEARFVPLLFHEDFTHGLAGWQVVDQGGNQGPSAWATVGHATITGTGATAAGDQVTLTGATPADMAAIEVDRDVVVLATDTARPGKTYLVLSVNTVTKTVQVDGSPALSGGVSDWTLPAWGRLHQTSNIWGGSGDPIDPVAPGTMLLAGASGWTDYRLSVLVRPEDDDAVGIVFRYQGPNTYYRFAVDRERGYRRLVRVVGGVHTLLGEDDLRHPAGSDLLLTAEAVGDRIAVFVDETLAFAVTDGALSHGQIGLYCWANQDARWSDVRVDDLSAEAPVPYRFSFTTSDYVDFFHQIHAHADESWASSGPQNAVADLAAAVSPSTAPAEAEHRAYDAFAGKVLGPTGRRGPDGLETTVVRVGNTPIATLVRGAEPIDWRRAAVAVSRATELTVPAIAPGAVKLTDLAQGGTDPNDEAVTLLTREQVSLAGHAVEVFGPAGPLTSFDQAVLGYDGFDGPPSGVLLEQAFGPAALSRYQVVDEAGTSGSSAWAVSGGAIEQTSNIFGGSVSGSVPDKPGTIALTGDAWGNVRITATLRSSDNDAIGIVFRYQGPNHYYRFSMDAERSYRRLVKRVGGVVTTLWQDDVAYTLNQSYRLELLAYRETLIGYLDGTPLFVVSDDAIAAGRVGLYSWANIGARFESLRVETLDTTPLLWAPALADLSEVEVVDQTTEQAPSGWAAGSGELTQTSSIGATGPSADPEWLGTVALSPGGYPDHRVSVRFTADSGGSIGVYFRYLGPDDWYRFALDTVTGTRRLVRKTAATVAVIWQAAGSFVTSQLYDLTIEAVGPRLSGWLDGALLFDVVSDGPAVGRMGLHTASCPTARFSQIVITDLARTVGQWRAADLPIALGGPSSWTLRAGALRQTSDLTSPGTAVVTGAPEWRDYRVRAGMMAPNGVIGLVARWRDVRHHYRLALSPSSAVLIKQVGGAATVLWQDNTTGYPAGQTFTVTLDATGDRLTGYLGDVLLFAVTDTELPAGVAGPYCASAPQARFEEVSVSGPPLDAYALYRDRFRLGDMSGWTVVDQSNAGGPAAWAILDRELVQQSNAHTVPFDFVTALGTHAVTGDSAWRDVLLSVRLRSMDNDAIGVLFRYVDDNNYYRFAMDSERSYRRLVKRVGGVTSVLWEDTVAYQVGRSYDLVISAIGGRLRGWLDGVPVFSVADGDLAQGRVGVYCWAVQGARFERVAVHPATVGYRDWSIANDLDGLGIAGWDFITAGDVGGPAVWEVTGGELRQTSAVHDSAVASDLAKPGTLALPDAGDLADFRLTVRLRSDTDRAIGVVFRYADPDNWYRFSMDRALGYRRLVRSVGGVVSQLWADSVQFQVGHTYLVTVDAIGGALTGYLDGVELFRVHDDAIPAGRVGLYCWNNTGARFSRLEVAPPGWRVHYRFPGSEPLLAAGTRVRVHSGNASDWTEPPAAGLIHRFVATLGDPGQRRLGDREVRLGVRDVRDPVGHARTFLPPSAFVAAPTARVLRKADGTEFAFTIGSPPALPSGTYRLQLTYRRDNTTTEPGSDVLSRAGDSSDETVVLDVPWASG
ncbi:MAG: hypothetical protein L0Y54_08675 [Sporichthyaceae bacterium]|nr:hypothetical protein [Sporichthyaceae bacterium]